MELVRFFTAGNVDDGKSTLIGRLLYDSGAISTDIIETLTRQSKQKAENADIDLALLTDGLRAEREQGITIDVAYKYFSSEKRKYIIADTPGHAQYTRNMFTGASTADLAILLIDARLGITEQTRRHSTIVATLGIPNVIVAINKMDLVKYSQARYEEIEAAYARLAEALGIQQVSSIPLSALTGENVVHRSENMQWYLGKTLFEALESVELINAKASNEARFQVQYVIRPQTTELHDYRGYAGEIRSGSFHVGQQVRVYPGEHLTTIAAIEYKQQQVDSASQGCPVVIHLADAIDSSRGASIVAAESNVHEQKELVARLCWMDDRAFQKGQKVLLQHGSLRTRAIVQELIGKINIETGEVEASEDGTIALNELAQVRIKTADSLIFDPYLNNRKTGAFILIHEQTNATLAAGVIEE